MGKAVEEPGKNMFIISKAVSHLSALLKNGFYKYILKKILVVNVGKERSGGINVLRESSKVSSACQIVQSILCFGLSFPHGEM